MVNIVHEKSDGFFDLCQILSISFNKVERRLSNLNLSAAEVLIDRQ